MGKVEVGKWDLHGVYLAELDSNQRIVASEAMDRLAIAMPNADAEEITVAAVALARESVPTVREAVDGIVELRSGPAYVYLAMYGMAGVVRYVKVGMSSHPEQRMYGMGTANPLDCLFVYVARAVSRKRAYACEQALLRELSESRRKGEWVELELVGPEAAERFARSMSGLLECEDGSVGAFELLGYTDGRRVA